MKTLALALASLLFSLSLIEIWARVSSGPLHYHEGGSLHYDPDLGFRELPGLEASNRDAFGTFRLRLNRTGFRGRDLPSEAAPKPEETRRILFVGDSFLVAWQVRDKHLMSAVVESDIQQREHPAEAYVLASSDYGTAQELLLLRRYAARIQPDVIILVMYPGNDIANNGIELAEKTSVSPGDALRPYLVPNERGELETRYAQPVRALARRYSKAFRLLELRLLGMSARSRPSEAPAPLLGRGRMPRDDLEVFRKDPPDADWQAAWHATFALLRAFREESQRLGARFLVLVIPQFQQVVRDADVIRLELLTRRFAGTSLDALLDWNLPEQRLAAFAVAEGIDVRLLLDPLRRASVRERDVYASDWHLAWRGHALAAHEVTEWYFAGSRRPPALQTRDPVERLQAPQAAPAWLDFRQTPHADQLIKGGWLSYAGSGPRGKRGWTTAPEPSLVLPARRGDLIVRGVVPPALIPLSIEFGARWARTERFRISRAGPFELRVAAPLPEARSDDFVLVDIHPDPVLPGCTRNPAPFEESQFRTQCPGLLIREIGFTH